MNDEAHAAKYVTKTHTTNVSTFQTPTHGPLGLIMKQEILYFKTAEPRVRFDLNSISGLVPIIPAYAGMKTELLDMLDLDKIDGLIIEAFGAGNLPKEVADKLADMIADGLPVARSLAVLTGLLSQSMLMKEAEFSCTSWYLLRQGAQCSKSQNQTAHRPECWTQRPRLRDYMEG